MVCNNLVLGLEELQHYNYSTLWLEQGNYSLSDKGSSIEGNYRFSWMTGISIRSVSTDITKFGAINLPVVIQCKTRFGLSFIHVTRITLKGIQFVGCGTVQNTTSKISNDSNFEQAIFAVYFLYCSTVTLQYITIQDTPGTGMVMYGTIGKNEITNCSFISNSVEEGSSGGGGLYIEFPHCAPTPSSNQCDCSMTTNIPVRYISDSEYYITTCLFQNNVARVKNCEEYTFILPHWQTHLAFGRGGGLSIFCKGHSRNNIFQVSSSNFTGNTALWGGGLFIEYQDNSTNNSFILESSYVGHNEVLYKTDDHKGTGGGGVRIGYIFFNNAHVSSNNMSFLNVNFEENQAYFGGGLLFYTAKENIVVSATNSLGFWNCTWTSNIARVGSAVDLLLWHASHKGVILQPTFQNCTFSKNSASYTTGLESYPLGVGAFYSDSIPVKFYTFTKFESNQQSALACIGAKIIFEPGCNAKFINNTGRNGGAIALLGLAFLVVSSETKLTFENNLAEIKGGAIYGHSIGNHDLISSQNCFIQYGGDIKSSPFEWDSSFVFINNRAKSENNSIYVTSLLSCAWGGASGTTMEKLTSVLCWNKNNSNTTQWYYSSGCQNEIETAPAALIINHSNTQFPLRVYPGIKIPLPFYVEDDTNQNVTNSAIMTANIITKDVNSCVTHIDSSSLYISDNAVNLHGIPGTTINISLETIDPRVIAYHFEVEFKECPLGMSYNTDEMETECHCEGPEAYGTLVKCDHNPSRLLRGAWFGKIPNQNYVAGLSPYTSSLSSDQHYDLPLDYIDLCKKVNRTGTLCGHCLPNHGNIVNGGDLACHYCSSREAKYNWVFYLFTEFFPIFIFFLIVILFNISATSGPANSFVFFAQVLTSVFKIDGDGVIQMKNITTNAGALRSVYITVYDIWNQNFLHLLLPKFCISSNITTLQVLATGYITAFFPLFLVMAFSFFLWAHGRDFIVVVCLCYPLQKFFSRFRKIWNLQNSIIHALATFILLSYTKFTLVSFVNQNGS